MATRKSTPRKKTKSAARARATKKAPATKKKAAHRSRKKSGDEGPASGHRALWTGAISFGLVQIPVRLIGAEKANELSFHQIDRRDLSRIRYQRINEETEELVEWSDIIKGYEMDDGTIVPIEDEDFEKANVAASHTIEIQDFVKREDIPAEYFEKPYFIVPQRSTKPYAVLRDAMIEKGYVAIALVVIRTRQHLCAVIPEGRGLILEMLRFPDELKPANTVADELPEEGAATQKELALASQLIETLAGDFDPKKYKDTFKDEMLEAIAKKAKTGKIPAAKKPRSTAKVTDLVALLKKSVAAGGKKGAA